MVVDALAAILDKAKAAGHILGIIPHLVEGGDVSLLQYADDTILVLPACPQQALVLKNILTYYATSVGLKINFHKSTIIPINCAADRCEQLVRIFGCVIGKMPFTYLGLPMTIRKQTTSQFQRLVDRVRSCLPHWKAAMMPKSGRALLISFVLCAIPVYSMLARDVPPKMGATVAKICRGLLWCGKNEAPGGKCVVAWEAVCTPRWAGGLGIPNLRWMNKAL